MNDRILHPGLAARVCSAEEAAAHIRHGQAVAMSGFTGAGYPKAVPQALASRMRAAHAAGEDFRVRVLTGASTAPELDGELARAEGIQLRLPYQSDPAVRERINAGTLDYIDMHLSHVAQYTWFGFFGDVDVAVVEVTAIREDGRLVPSSSVGNNKTWLDQAAHVILEVNRWQPMALDGMHDVYYGTERPPNRKPIPLVQPDDRIGERYLRVDPDKVVAIVETDSPDRNTPFAPPDGDSRLIAGHLLEFLDHEVRRGRLQPGLLPLQSGVGNIANAVLAGLQDGGYRGLTAFTEVIQDGMLALLKSGVLRMASATAFSLSPDGIDEFEREIDFYRKRIVLRPQEMSNHPELIRRLGCIAMNGMIEADLYGHVNSTHVAGSKIMNGIGGSGDFARNAYLSVFMSPSTAKNGVVSSIVPMASHVDHTEHDVMVLVTEQGLADLRGLSPKQRARLVIERCAHPNYRPMLQDYFDRACRDSYGKHSPHLLREALSWHQRFVETGSMRG
ncbi:MAG: acetyl-CoA hydrolase/transferase family protein [Pseudomonadota bacterium]